ncbi:MAG: putative Endonuclease 4 [Promethearchaeota archaeon]|nr:MAG: putative Endonuclease 4 [Candidatus Lokiarchaeota archaeon]
MKLGIASIAFLNNNIRSKTFEYSQKLLFDAFEKTLLFAERNNLELCEFILDPPEFLMSPEKEHFIELFNSFPSIEKQIHAPYVDLSLCSLNGWIRRATIKTYAECAKFANKVKANLLTIHPGNVKFLHHSYKNIQKVLETSLNHLLKEISDLKVFPSLENMQNKYKIFFDVSEISSFFKNFKEKELYFTWDTGHSKTSNLNIEQLWSELHHRIKNIHLADNYHIFEDSHPELGTGNVNFSKIFEISQNYNYKGAYIMELHRLEDLVKSLNYVYKFI